MANPEYSGNLATVRVGGNPLKPLIGLAPVLRGTPVQSEFEADCDIDYTSSPT